MRPYHVLAVLLPLSLAQLDPSKIDIKKILQLQAQIPKCATQCIEDTAAEFGCMAVDIECQCNKTQDIIQDVAPCMVKAGCGLDDIANSAQVSFKICKEVGLTPEDMAAVDAGNSTETVEESAAGRLVPWKGVTVLFGAAIVLL